MGDIKFETTTLTEMGQIAIPQDILKELHLKPGSRFIITGRYDTVMLKRIHRLKDDFEEMVEKAQESPIVKKLAELPEEKRTEEIQRVIHDYRKEKRKGR